MVSRILPLALFTGCCLAQQPFFDRTHASQVFGQPRQYRIFLPAGYEQSAARYPVIYYFHGHSDRYTLERYDNGSDTVPKIAAFVARNPVIVVSVDGYVARDYTGFYGGSPWDIREQGGASDFGPYFLELVQHIDSTYRTLTSRRFRATSGLSMGGFMSLYLSARYPDRIGSASSFNPGPEFYVGETGRRFLWRPKDHVHNHTRTKVRLIRASGDYISQYHEQTRDAYARAEEVEFEFRQDEYHRHWATSIAETFDFHRSAFDDPALDNVPEIFSHSNPYRRFSVWNYNVEADAEGPGLIVLERVRQGGMRVTTRLWAPDGPPATGFRITIETAPLYEAGAVYQVMDLALDTREVTRREAKADAAGRLRVTVDGRGHEISFHGPGTGADAPVLLPLTTGDTLRLPPDEDLGLPVRIYNPRREAMASVRVEVSTEYPTVSLSAAAASIERLEPGQTIDLAGRLRARLTAGDGYFAPARVDVKVVFDGWHSVIYPVRFLVIPAHVPAPAEVAILDGREKKLTVFHQRGNQGGGGPLERVVREGAGNGNGVLEPGEEATIWVRLAQGLDPFDKNNWYRAKVYGGGPWLSEIADLQEQKQREWTGAKERTSVIRLSSSAPAGARIPLLLDNESWSFHFTPDYRYGRQRLYQAFQLHRRHLHRYELIVP